MSKRSAVQGFKSSKIRSPWFSRSHLLNHERRRWLSMYSKPHFVNEPSVHLVPSTVQLNVKADRICSQHMKRTVQKEMGSRKLYKISNLGFQSAFPWRSARKRFRTALCIPPKTSTETHYQVTKSQLLTQINPSRHKEVIAEWAPATASDVKNAISSALAAKSSWENTPFEQRAAIFLRAAELVSKKYRYELMAAVMMG